MEENLGMTVENLLPIMQDTILNNNRYFGIRTWKCPLDAWIYQEIIFETKPDVIIEIGNAFGGSALYLAHLFDAIGHGRIIGLDISHQNISNLAKNHPRISFIEGDACSNFENVRKLIGDEEKVLIIEDSSHTLENTLNVLRTFSSLIKPEGYFVVEDGICAHGLEIGPTPGPYEAIEQFLKENNNFESDRNREKFVLTWNPKGFLKKIR